MILVLLLCSLIVVVHKGDPNIFIQGFLRSNVFQNVSCQERLAGTGTTVTP
jgi:hypothetical protein